MSISDSSSSSFSAAGLGRRLAYPRSLVDIHLDNHFQARVYSSGDTITGSVTIVPQRDIPFDAFEVALVGSAHSRVDTISAPIRSTHVFLMLLMPIPESAYPVPRVLEAGRTYTLPLHFVVPHQLTLSACNHPVASDDVRQHHMRLPPTMGAYGNNIVGSSSGGDGERADSAAAASSANTTAAWERDDLAPEMARIEYAIKARVYRDTFREGAAAGTGGAAVRTKVFEATRALRILPCSFADPPLQVGPADRLYRLEAAKALRKGVFARTKLGRVTAVVGGGSDGGGGGGGGTSLPGPFVVRPDGIAAAPTTAAVQLFFDPARPDVPAPRITHVSAKLTAHTHFSTSAIASFPDRGDWTRRSSSDTVLAERRVLYTTSVPLLSQPVRDFQWEAQVAVPRRDSGYGSSDSSGEGAAQPTKTTAPSRRRSPRSSDAAAAAAASAGGGLVYAAQLVVPLALPLDRKTVLPTFHSCVVSRTYALQLAISVVPASSTSSSSASSSASAGTTLSLSLPVQVVVGDTADSSLLLLAAQDAKDVDDQDGLPSFEHALEEADADAHLRPRVLSVPDEGFRETSTLPGYARR